MKKLTVIVLAIICFILCSFASTNEHSSSYLERYIVKNIPADKNKLTKGEAASVLKQWILMTHPKANLNHFYAEEISVDKLWLAMQAQVFSVNDQKFYLIKKYKVHDLGKTISSFALVSTNEKKDTLLFIANPCAGCSCPIVGGYPKIKIVNDRPPHKCNYPLLEIKNIKEQIQIVHDKKIYGTIEFLSDKHEFIIHWEN